MRPLLICGIYLCISLPLLCQQSPTAELSNFYKRMDAKYGDYLEANRKGQTWRITTRQKLKSGEWDTVKNKLTALISKKNKNNDLLYELIEDDEKILWVTSQKAIYRCDIGKHQCKKINLAFDCIGIFKSRENKIAIIGLKEGIGVFLEQYQHKQRKFKTIPLTALIKPVGSIESLRSRPAQKLNSRLMDLLENKDVLEYNFSMNRTEYLDALHGFTLNRAFDFHEMKSDSLIAFSFLSKSGEKDIVHCLYNKNTNLFYRSYDRLNLINCLVILDKYLYGPEKESAEVAPLTSKPHWFPIDSLFINGNFRKAYPEGQFTDPEYDTLDYFQGNIRLLLKDKFVSRIKDTTYFQLLRKDAFFTGAYSDWKSLPIGCKEIKYADLPPEVYALMITKDRDDYTDQVSLVLHISPPFWRSGKFWAMIVAIAVIIGALILIIQIRRIKKNAKIREQILEAETLGLRAQMNSHVVMNVLNLIKVEYSNAYRNRIDSDFKVAENNLVRFTRLFRQIIDHSKQKTIHLKDEIDSVKNYLHFMANLHKDMINILIKVEEDLIDLPIKIPPNIVQPFAENAIKHGLLKKSNDRKLTISISSEEGPHNIAKQLRNQVETNRLIPIFGKLFIIIDDNGVGRIEAKKFQDGNDSSGIGIDNTLTRIQYFNKSSANVVDKFGCNGKSLGTVVEIILNININDI